MRAIALTTLLVLSVFAVQFVVMADNEPPPSAAFVVAALKNQLSARGEGLQVSYTWAESGQPKSDVQYIWMPSLKYMSLSKSDNNAFKSVYDNKTGEYRSIRHTSKSIRGVISPVAEELLSNQFTIDPIVRPLDDTTLIDVVARGIVSPTKEDIEGHPCWRVETSARTFGSSKYVIWVDPVIGFSPRKLELHGSVDSIPKTTVFSDYRELATDAWFPMKVTKTFQIPRTATESARMATFIHEVSKASANIVIPDDQVEIRFPGGTEVQDKLHDAEYVQP